MALTRLALHNFRCFDEVAVDLAPNRVVILGPNASGKTSFLEAVHLLGHGRSFRTRDLSSLGRFGASTYQVSGRISSQGRDVTISVLRKKAAFACSVGGNKSAAVADLATIFPVRVLGSEAHQLVNGTPKERRRILDWGVFHVEHGFLDQWRRYRRALSQRNEVLRRTGSLREIVVWDEELVCAGESITALREIYLDSIKQPLVKAMMEILGVELGLSYSRGWSVDRGLGEALSNNLEQDRSIGTTTAGPHRADLRVHFGGHSARSRASRGQSKVLSGLMIACQLSGFFEATGKVPTLLIDDLTAELDESAIDSLWRAFESISAQLIVSAVSPELVSDQIRNKSQVFHVEPGQKLKLV